MKKLIPTILILTLLVASLGGVAQAEAPVSAPEAAPAVQADSQVTPPQAPAPEEAMVPPIHALLLAMLDNDLTAYDADNPAFYWNSLYLMLSLYGNLDERAQVTDDTISIPSETVRDYAAALFPGFSGLPELPDSLSERISYRASDDTYLLARGDDGLSQLQVLDSTTLSDGRILVFGALVYLEDGSTILSFEATLARQDSMFGYTVTDLVIL